MGLIELFAGLMVIGHLCFFIGAFVFLLAWRKQCPRPAGAALWALGIMFALKVSSVVVPFLLVRNSGAQAAMTMVAMLNALLPIGDLVAVALLLRAVFLGRGEESAPRAPAFDAGDQPVHSDNPYLPPNVRPDST